MLDKLSVQLIEKEGGYYESLSKILNAGDLPSPRRRISAHRPSRDLSNLAGQPTVTTRSQWFNSLQSAI
jgi:hypothetical protein